MTTYDIDAALEHFRARTAYTTGVHELEVLIDSDTDPASYQIVDVRQAKDFAAGHIPGAVNLPRARWSQPRTLRKDALIYVYCYNQTCHLAAEAALVLLEHGYRVVEVEGGWDAWVASSAAIEVPARSA